jgi:hypothetical protein
MGELWRWNGHRTRSGSRTPEHDLAWQLLAPTSPTGLGQADTAPRRSFLGDSLQETSNRPSEFILGTHLSYESVAMIKPLQPLSFSSLLPSSAHCGYIGHLSDLHSSLPPRPRSKVLL